ncbi:MAG TPA: SusD/RagB family nutrient-binding outer membrane lipoprotein, partial [Flavitalea sp.]|nr:SusD/RagB family nutrient-binding outer membrane lipoprotein [Flavitalea sp.]
TMLFGDMPFEEAGKAYEGPGNYLPTYEPQSSIFSKAVADLASATNEFSDAADQVTLGGADVLFKNDITKWRKFANSLTLRYAMNMREKNPSEADPIIAAAISKPLLEDGDNYGFYASQVPDFFNNRRGYFDGNAYVRMGSTMFDAMSSSDALDGSGIFDLRTKIFFEPNKAGEWRPYPQAPTSSTEPELAAEGPNNPYQESRLTQYVIDGTYKYSPFNFYYVRDEQIPDLFITSSEVHFLLAEAYNKGIGVAANPATAKTHYEMGITESVKFWYKTANSSGIWAVNRPPAEPTAGELTAMLTHPEVAYSPDPATALSQIYKQEWIALFHQPVEAWNLQRRTGYATPFVPLASTSPVIDFNRFLYPNTEIETNFENWEKVTGGADDFTRKPWFMN